MVSIKTSQFSGEDVKERILSAAAIQGSSMIGEK